MAKLTDTKMKKHKNPRLHGDDYPPEMGPVELMIDGPRQFPRVERIESRKYPERQTWERFSIMACPVCGSPAYHECLDSAGVVKMFGHYARRRRAEQLWSQRLQRNGETN